MDLDGFGWIWMDSFPCAGSHLVRFKAGRADAVYVRWRYLGSSFKVNLQHGEGDLGFLAF